MAARTGIKGGRWTAEIEGDFVVFLIGARPNSWRLLRSMRDLGGARGMRKMLDHLSADPDSGLLGYETFGFLTVQYWRSFEHLDAFARDENAPHLEGWRNYWKRVAKSDRTGIWHETYLVRDGEFECIYGNMRPLGLGKATSLVPLAESSRARGRLRTRRAA